MCWGYIHCLLEDSTSPYRTSDNVVGGLSHDSLHQQQMWAVLSKYKASVTATHRGQIWCIPLKDSHTASYPVPSKVGCEVSSTVPLQENVASPPSTTVWLTSSVLKAMSWEEAVQLTNNREWTHCRRANSCTLPYLKLEWRTRWQDVEQLSPLIVVQTRLV